MAVVVVLNSQTEECHPRQDIVNASLVHDLVQVLFLLLHHILRLVDVDVSLLVFPWLLPFHLLELVLAAR